MNANLQHETDDDGNHLISVSGLRVMITEDQNGIFCAQGLDIDYAASGGTQEDVMENFVKGLCNSFVANINVFGSLRRFARVAPQEIWNEFYALSGDVAISRKPLERPDDCPELHYFHSSVLY